MLLSETEGWQAGRPVRAAERSAAVCAVPSQSEKEERWPLTTDSCQSDGALTLGRPMSSHGGDKCLADQLACKITALPSAAHISTCSDSTFSFRLSCSQPLCVSVSHSPTPVLLAPLERLRSLQDV